MSKRTRLRRFVRIAGAQLLCELGVSAIRSGHRLVNRQVEDVRVRSCRIPSAEDLEILGQILAASGVDLEKVAAAPDIGDPDGRVIRQVTKDGEILH